MDSCSAVSAEENSLFKLRINQVVGEANKTNDIFVFGQKENCKEHVIYFGGDVQDYSENMERHRDNKRYVQWNTEATAKLIHQKFPASLVFVIKPTKMHLLTFAVYSNFFEANDFGNPTHSSNFGAIRHLSSLYTSALKIFFAEDENSKINIPIRLIGFSKGCTVLNQIVYELHLTEKDAIVNDFVKKITAFYWLDGGHSGGANSNTWVTDDTALQNLASLNCDIFIHVSPYQIRDPMRKWIGQQESKFYKKLMALKAKVQEKEHFSAEPACIENHFKFYIFCTKLSSESFHSFFLFYCTTLLST
ncbi:hypothetical protein Btru_004332 [Bulinus truncatus]|nr:hypothetical protein Btru_004332 [Bulinus truncatus]